MTKKHAEIEGVPDVSTIAELRQQAALAPTLAAQQELIAKAEELEGQRRLVTTAERALDLTVKEAVEIVPHGLHELHSEATDWLTATASAGIQADEQEATQALVAEATLWFRNVPEIVREDADEFTTQAQNKARHVASQYGDHAEAAAQAFVAEASRLHKQASKLDNKTAAGFQDEINRMQDNINRMTRERKAREPEIEHARQRFHEQYGEVHGLTPDPDYRPPKHQAPVTPDRSELPAGSFGDEHVDIHARPSVHMPGIRGEINNVLHGNDANGVREMAEGFARSQVHGSQKVASLRGEGEDIADLSTVLAGFEVTSGLVDGAEQALDSGTGDLAKDEDDFARSQIGKGASTAPQSTSNSGPQTSGLIEYPPQTASNLATDSNRAPALQEIQNFTGWDGTSVVPTGDSGAAAANDDGGTQDASADDALSGNFPVGSTYASRNASKESAMTTEHRACPSCSGTGKVAVRKEAYSGLPQIDQIVNADETPGQEPAPGQSENYPTAVAFPLNPNWGTGQDVNNAIAQTEQLIGERNSRSPLQTAATQHQANGRDNSGWIGDMGARGLDYPGDSAPVGYDGSNNLGQPDPVYGYGGDNGNQPLKPYGAEEANDITNNPGQPYNPAAPHNNDQAYRSVTPGLSTSGSHDPVIAAAQEEILRQQRAIAERTAMLRRQGR